MSHHRVRIVPARWEMRADDCVPLVLAAEQVGISLPSSCRNGVCRACMCRLLEGHIDYIMEWPGLSKEEKAEGWILPCVALAGSDLLLEVPGATRLPSKPAA